MKWFEILEVNEEASKEEIKIAYFKKVKKYSPEQYGDMFIKIRKAYEYALKIKEKRNLYKELQVILSKKEMDKKKIEIIKEVFKNINLDNFQNENENLLKVLIELRKRKLYEEALFIIAIAKKKFKNLGLLDLRNAYERLEEAIVEDL